MPSAVLGGGKERGQLAPEATGPGGRKKSRRKEVQVDGVFRSLGIRVWPVPAERLKALISLSSGGRKSKVMVWEASSIVL